MIRHAAIAGVLLGIAAHDPSCGSVDSSSKGLNAPCTRAKDCAAGLVCPSGVCVLPDAGDEAGGDAAAAQDAAGDEE